MQWLKPSSDMLFMYFGSLGVGYLVFRIFYPQELNRMIATEQWRLWLFAFLWYFACLLLCPLMASRPQTGRKP
jgi:hypothetical protein